MCAKAVRRMLMKLTPGVAVEETCLKKSGGGVVTNGEDRKSGTGFGVVGKNSGGVSDDSKNCFGARVVGEKAVLKTCGGLTVGTRCP
jgi:hypothetical protein